jgi:hypothetical protein
MNKYRIINPNNNIVRDCKSRTTGGGIENPSGINAIKREREFEKNSK